MRCFEAHARYAGVSAFQAPGKRHKAHLQEGGAKGGPSPALQLLETPRPAGLPHLKVPTPGVGGAQATMESSNAAPFSVSPSFHAQCTNGSTHVMPWCLVMQTAQLLLAILAGSASKRCTCGIYMEC